MFSISIRNVDLESPVYIRSVTYYDTRGNPIKEHLDRLISLKPLETIAFLVEARDSTGGSGANFIVEWLSTEPVEQPMVEAVMVGVSGTQGICFSRPGRVLTMPSARPQ